MYSIDFTKYPFVHSYAKSSLSNLFEEKSQRILPDNQDKIILKRQRN